MKRNNGKEQNRASSELSNSRGHAQQGMAHATLAPDLWGQGSVTSTALVGTPKHRYPHLSSKNNAHYTLAKWDEKTKV
jgi:hypothetical protein